MKEIHAIQNEDGTYRLEMITEIYVGEELTSAKVVYERANLKIDALQDLSTGTICNIIVEED